MIHKSSYITFSRDDPHSFLLPRHVVPPLPSPGRGSASAAGAGCGTTLAWMGGPAVVQAPCRIQRFQRFQRGFHGKIHPFLDELSTKTHPFMVGETCWWFGRWEDLSIIYDDFPMTNGDIPYESYMVQHWWIFLYKNALSSGIFWWFRCWRSRN